MANYMLLLHDDPAIFKDFSPEQFQEIILRYRNWGQSLRDAGRWVDGHKLVDGAGRTLRREGGETRVIDGPFSETKEVVAGYFSITAASYDEAVEIAMGSPHLDYGTLEIREIER